MDEDGAGDVGGGGAVIDPRILDEPNGEDSDGDGISDLDEMDIFGTDPQLADTDGDGVNDGLENQNGLDPLFGAPEDKEQFDEMVAEFEASQVSGPSTPEDSIKENIIPLFWVYYPHAREILKKGQAFNNRNTSKYISFDDIINSRRFSSVIYKEENVYENREVKDYIKNNSFMRLLESERIKEKIGCASSDSEELNLEVRGRNLAEGVPNTLNLSSKEVYEAISGPLSAILQSIRNALEQSPPELSADISERGIVLTGGGALLRDLDIMISDQTGIPVYVAEDPLTCVAKGGGIALDILDKYDVDLLSTE